MEITPKRRLDISYWLATFQAILMMSTFQSLADGESLGAYWILFVFAWLVIGFLYIKNNMAFEKETLWMTIKNPAKVTREEGETFQLPGMPPPPGSRPPPPPRPPVPHHKRTYINGPAWPPKKP